MSPETQNTVALAIAPQMINKVKEGVPPLENDPLEISPFGNQQNPTSRAGQALGAQDAPVGTSNAQP